MHYLVFVYIFYMFINDAVSNNVHDQIIYVCRGPYGIDTDAIVCPPVNNQRWCCDKDAICGNRYGICTKRYKPPGLSSSITVAIILSISLICVALLYGMIHYIRVRRRQRKAKSVSISLSILNPLSDISTSSSLATSTPLKTISATLSESSA